jgi:hypothetical protein
MRRNRSDFCPTVLSKQGSLNSEKESHLCLTNYRPSPTPFHLFTGAHE